MEVAGGVDKFPQPRFPFPFIESDAIEFLKNNAEWIRAYIDLVDSSPPCQGYSATQRLHGKDWPALIGPTREVLEWLGVPAIIENVEDARPEMRDPVTLCGSMFGLNTYRHRLIETIGWDLSAPAHAPHERTTVKMGRAVKPGDQYHAVGHFSGVGYVREDMGVPWMTREGIAESVPPAYTRWIGRQFIARWA